MSQRASFPTVRSLELLLSAVLVTSAARAEPSVAEPTPEAREHFKAGVAHLEGDAAERFALAYREFKAAYAAAPVPKILHNLGIAARGLERYGEAIEAFERYLQEGPQAAVQRERAAIEKALGEMRLQVATVTLEAPGTFWIVDTRLDGERAIVNEYGPFSDRVELRVRAGQHEFKLDRNSSAAMAWRATLFPGDAAAHSFAPEPPPAVASALLPLEPDTDGTDSENDIAPASHTVSYVLWGAGAAGAIATGVVGLNAIRLQNNADEAFATSCPNGEDPSAASCVRALETDARAANWRTATLLTGVGAAGLLIGGTVLYLIDGGATPSGEADEASVQPWVSPNSLGVSGTF